MHGPWRIPPTRLRAVLAIAWPTYQALLTRGQEGEYTSARRTCPEQMLMYGNSKCFDTIVRIKVGKGDAQEVFEVYKGLLKFYSGYFRAAIDNMEAGRFLQSEVSGRDIT